MTSTKKQDWDWRDKVKLAVAVAMVVGFFVGAWLMPALDHLLMHGPSTGEMMVQR